MTGVSQNPKYWPPDFDMHIVPINDHAPTGGLVIHFAHPDCWCHPGKVEGCQFYTHNALDCRDSRERHGVITGDGWVTVGSIVRLT